MSILFSQEACEACSRFAETSVDALAQFNASTTPVDNDSPTYDVEANGYHPDD